LGGAGDAVDEGGRRVGEGERSVWEREVLIIPDNLVDTTAYFMDYLLSWPLDGGFG
jgi:hypothetical protein